MRNTRSRVGIAALSVALVALIVAFATSMGSVLEAQRAALPADGYITGVVQGASGPEAGVWVIAETKDLPDQLHQDRRHRRPRALHAAGTAGGELQRVGARIRPGRFEADPDEAEPQRA